MGSELDHLCRAVKRPERDEDVAAADAPDAEAGEAAHEAVLRGTFLRGACEFNARDIPPWGVCE